MRIIVQRSHHASVSVSGRVVGQIEHGLVLLVGITHEDTLEDVKVLAHKIAGLRIFDDRDGKMNVSIQDVAGHVLSISQFTLYSDCSQGKRPSYRQAAKPEHAKPLYDKFNELLAGTYGLVVQTGIFGEMMDVKLTNAGPVTIILDSQELK